MSPRRENTPLQVAAVCYRPTSRGPAFLLVRTLDGKWTFPKGQIDDGMSEVEAAENEAWEEGGVTGRVRHKPLTSYLYTKGGNSNGDEIEVNVYLMEVLEARPPLEPHRDPRWFFPQEAKEALAEGRITKYARELARVVDLAVEHLGET